MSRPLIGQVLGRMGKLSTIDIDEILAEQLLSRRLFGEIALAWGVCEPKHLCDALCSQLGDGLEMLDLSEIDVSEPALACLSSAAAREARLMPVGMIGDELIIATASPPEPAEAARIARLAGREVRFVRVEAGQLDEAIELHYSRAA
jgi:hypothetical protein